MEEKRKETAQILRQLFRNDFKVMVAKVESVSGNICHVIYQDIPLEVRLKATEDDSTEALIVTPKKGSNVLIAPIENSDFFVVIKCDEIDKIEYKVSDTHFVVAKDKVEITSGGKFKINNSAQDFASLIDELFSLLAEFSVLETDQGVPKPSTANPANVIKVNALKTKFKALLN